MQSQANLARAFENGATRGRASSVEVRECEGGHALVDTRGKGAVYAYRYPSGHVVAFEGWYGYSPSTSCALTKMGLSYVCRHDEDRDYRANATAADAPITRVGGSRQYIGDWLDEHDPTHIGQAVSRVNK
jgi:hypothetical protein